MAASITARALAVFASAIGRPITKSSSIWLKTVHAPDYQTDQKWFQGLFLSAARGINSPFCAMIAIPTARPANAKRSTGASMAEPNLCTFSIMRLYALSGCRVSGRMGRAVFARQGYRIFINTIESV